MKWTPPFGESKMRWKAGSFYRTMNKEEKNRKYVIGWGHIVDLLWGEEEQKDKFKAQN